MRTLLIPAVVVAAFSLMVMADDKPTPKADSVTALQPHPLDDAFAKAMNTKTANEGLLNNDLYKKAVQESLKAKRDMEEQYRKNPGLRSSTPAQAARVAFLRVLAEAEDKPGK